MHSSSSIAIVDYDICCAAGSNLNQFRRALESKTSGLVRNDMPDVDLETWIGKVSALDDLHWSDSEHAWQSRNNGLIRYAWENASLAEQTAALVDRFGATRVGIAMGSSTSSIDRTETAYRHLVDDKHLAEAFKQSSVLNPHAPGLYLAELTGIQGPCITVNTACSSSAKVFATAARWLSLGVVDAVLVGGADTLCGSVLYGFNSLQLVSDQACRPFDAKRDGINLGEAAGFALLTRREDLESEDAIQLCGYGESSDAHHMSHPHPEGAGARQAIEAALERASLTPSDIDYINLHGTASRANDTIEGGLVASMFGADVMASSTKGWTGHTLGAAGIVECIVAMDALRTGLVPGTLNLEEIDPEVPLKLTADNRQTSLRYAMSNSFGFGGNNCSVIFGSPGVAA